MKKEILTSRSSKPQEIAGGAGDPRSRSGSSAGASMLFHEQQADEDDLLSSAPRDKSEFYQSSKPNISRDKKAMTGRKAGEAKTASKNKLNSDIQKKLMLSNESISQHQPKSQRLSSSSGTKVANFFTSLRQQASFTKRQSQALLDSAGKPIRRRLANDISFLRQVNQGNTSARSSLELRQPPQSSGNQ